MSAPMAMDLEKIFVREVERNDETILRINQSEIGDVGCVVWDAALVLAKYLETDDLQHGRDLVDKSVIELGAGTGVVGLMAASYGARVTLTDLKEFVPLLQLNVDMNKHVCPYTVNTVELKWGTDVTAFSGNTDILLVADCVYYEESLEPLVRTIRDLSDVGTCVYCSYEERRTGDKPRLQRQFFKMIEEHFTAEEISIDRHDEHFRSDDIHIFKFTKIKDK